MEGPWLVTWVVGSLPPPVEAGWVFRGGEGRRRAGKGCVEVGEGTAGAQALAAVRGGGGGRPGRLMGVLAGCDPHEAPGT